MGAPGFKVWREAEEEEKTCPEVEGQQVCEIQGGSMVMKSKKEEYTRPLEAIGRLKVCECMFLGAMTLEASINQCLHFQKIDRCSNPQKGGK